MPESKLSSLLNQLRQCAELPHAFGAPLSASFYARRCHVRGVVVELKRDSFSSKYLQTASAMDAPAHLTLPVANTHLATSPTVKSASGQLARISAMSEVLLHPNSLSNAGQ